MKSPIELATADTMEYIGGVLPHGGARILEVGCGRGEVAASLVRAGHDVVGVDPDADAVAAARSRDVDARRGRFPDDIPEGPFDAVLFTRSLHHIAGLPTVYDAACDVLSARGQLIVEDWAWNRVDMPTATWGARLLELGVEVGLADVDDWVRQGDPHEAWHEEHGHHGLHFGETMWGAAGKRFAVTEIERGPYFYRYFCRSLPVTEQSCRIAARILAMERAMIRQGQIIALGMRFSGVRR